LAALPLALLGLLLVAGGCSSLRPKPEEQFVYVTAKQTYLRDRVAAVSNRTGTVENGQRLKVLEHGRRFLRVQGEKGETGWIDEKTVATQQVFDAFAALGRDHEKDPTVASGVARDEVYLHLAPGRSTEKFYRLAEGEKLSLLKRATLPKGGGPKSDSPNQKAGPLKDARQAAIPGAATGIKAAQASNSAAAADVPAAASGASNTAGRGGSGEAGTGAEAGEPPAPPAMEDWWLVRDSHGHAGWMLSRLLDVDAPDALTRYAEGQRIVGAYLLTTVNDPDAPQDVKDVPEYVTVLSPYKAGLTYDFDQVRVFIWVVKKHRYETAFREKNIAGYLPVQVKMMQDLGGKAANSGTPLPGFTYNVLPADAAPVVPDPETGAIVPGPTIAKTYRLEGNILHRLLPPGAAPPDELHPDPEPEKKGKKKGKSKR
jgi:SH3-like domain-containing protein